MVASIEGASEKNEGFRLKMEGEALHLAGPHMKHCLRHYYRL